MRSKKIGGIIEKDPLFVNIGKDEKSVDITNDTNIAISKDRIKSSETKTVCDSIKAQRIGVAKDKLKFPEDFDGHNDEIAELFGVKISCNECHDAEKTILGNYVCKIASIDEVIAKWDKLIAQNPEEPNWVSWKAETIENVRTGRKIPYYGVLDGEIICEAYAEPGYDPAAEGGVSSEPGTVYLSAFRTDEGYRRKGFFSKLMAFMLADLKQKDFIRAIVGVEPWDTLNKELYRHWGFTELVYSGTCTYPDGEVIEVEYYAKTL